MISKTTLVLGASLKESRFSNMCIRRLLSAGIPVTAIGLREGDVAGVHIQTGCPDVTDIHTVTLYLGPQNQSAWFAYVVKLKPVRVIFNPGTENTEFQRILTGAGISFHEDCTLMMLEEGRF